MSPINLLQVTEDHSVHNTGITSALDALMRQVAHMPAAMQQSLICTGDDPIPLPAGVTMIRLPASGLRRIWQYSPAGSQSLLQAVQQAGVIHLHGIWMWIQWAAARAAHQEGKPFVLSVHGMLEPWIWQRQSWPHRLKKDLYWRFMAYPAFHHAKIIHAIHPNEAETLKEYFAKEDHNDDEPIIEVIPHSLDLDAIDGILEQIDPDSWSSDLDRQLVPSSFQSDPYILFLGRLHPVKGIDLLIRAFGSLDIPRVKLKIAGYTQAREAAYEAHLHQLVVNSRLGERVEFLGPLEGSQKWELIRNAWVFCLPSYSEVIGMVNLEAAACCTPVITTYATGVGSDWAKCGGVLIEPDSAQLANALTKAMSWTIQERTERGKSLRQLIETTYSWSATSMRWHSLYERLGAMT